MRQAWIKTWNSIKVSLPMMIGILMLINFLNPLFQKFYPIIFTGNYIIDPLIGAIAGSISFGIPVISYITGGELLKHGVSLLAVTAFVLTWSTVGVAWLPMEMNQLGKKFAILRNSINFITSIIISILTILILNIIHGYI